MVESTIYILCYVAFSGGDTKQLAFEIAFHQAKSPKAAEFLTAWTTSALWESLPVKTDSVSNCVTSFQEACQCYVIEQLPVLRSVLAPVLFASFVSDRVATPKRRRSALQGLGAILKADPLECVCVVEAVERIHTDLREEKVHGSGTSTLKLAPAGPRPVGVAGVCDCSVA